jgi:hypothetical protein
VGASFEVDDLPPEISLLSLYLVDVLLVRMALPLSNGGASRVLGLKILWVQGKGGPNRPPEWAGPAGLGRPTQAHLSPVQSPLRSRGSLGDYALCPLHLHDFDDVILASKMEVLRT